MEKIRGAGGRRFGAGAQPAGRDHRPPARHGMRRRRASDPLVAREMIRELHAGRAHARRRDAAHGRPRLPGKADAPAADAGGDGVVADRARRRGHAARAGAGRGRLRHQAEARRSQTASRDYAEKIADKIRSGGTRARPRRAPPCHGGRRAAPAPPRRCGNPLAVTEKLIIIGASTGGTEAIREVLMQLPPDCAGDPDRAAHAGRLHAARSRSASTAVRDRASRRRADGERDAARPRLHRARRLATCA